MTDERPKPKKVNMVDLYSNKKAVDRKVHEDCDLFNGKEAIFIRSKGSNARVTIYESRNCIWIVTEKKEGYLAEEPRSIVKAKEDRLLKMITKSMYRSFAL